MIQWPDPNANERVSVGELRRATASCLKRDCYSFSWGARVFSEARPSDLARAKDLGDILVNKAKLRKLLFPYFKRKRSRLKCQPVDRPKRHGPRVRARFEARHRLISKRDCHLFGEGTNYLRGV